MSNVPFFSRTFSVGPPIVVDPFCAQDRLDEALQLFEEKVKEQKPKFIWVTITDNVLPDKIEALSELVELIAEFQDTHGGYMVCTGPKRSPIWDS